MDPLQSLNNQILNAMNSSKSAFLSKSEKDWLIGSKKISKSYEYKIKSTIRKKLDTLYKFELPLIQNSRIFSNSLTAFSKDLTAFSKIEYPIISTELPQMQNQTQNKSLGRDLDPGPLPYQGNALPG